MDINKKSLEMHYELKGKIEVISRKKIETREDLSLAYTPGVAEPCLAIADNYQKSFLLTRRNNLVAVITDGTAVLGLGDIGPAAGMPVMEGKCALFKEFADVDAFPICINSKDTDTIVQTIYLISQSFGGINLEDISAPRCFEIEQRLKEVCDIPVFHDDQHGTAIVVAAALINALKVSGKKMGALKIVINGIGSAGVAIAKLLLHMNFGELILCDKNGIICEGDDNLNEEQQKLSRITNKSRDKGQLSDAMKEADVFIGVSRPGLVTSTMVASMNHGIVFALANPTPEIMPEEAKLGGAIVIGTGRSDYPNQINNVLVFPGIFKGALAVGAKDITNSMKQSVAYTLAEMVPASKLNAENILPSPLEKSVAEHVARAVAEVAIHEGNLRTPILTCKHE